MDKETCNRLAEQLAQALFHNLIITEKQKSGAKIIIAMELDKEFVRPLEELNRRNLEKNLKIIRIKDCPRCGSIYPETDVHIC
jgi:AAA+ ATPase superfamily predicted ATPase